MTSERKKINFTEEERSVLIDLVTEMKDVVENKRTDAVSVNHKKKVWEEIALRFNSRHGVRPRNSQQLRKCWENLKEKWRRCKATDTKELFRTGGGSAVQSTLTEELERVGAVASHMSVRIPNPFDSDRARHDASDSANGGTYADECTAAVARLLAPMQTAPIAALHENEDADELPDIYEGDTDICLSSEDQAGGFLPPPRPQSPQPPAPAPGLRQNAGSNVQNGAPHGKASRRRTALEEELEARLQAVTDEKNQRRREHLLRMRMMRAERKEKKALNEQKLLNAKAKASLLKIQMQLMQRKA